MSVLVQVPELGDADVATADGGEELQHLLQTLRVEGGAPLLSPTCVVRATAAKMGDLAADLE
jgi:hypothetical protein